jgi:glycosyltransferase involved in cell wall biosynthesis
MKIAFVSAMGAWPWGGSEELWSQAALRLVKEGHRVSMAVCSWPQRPLQIQSLINHGVHGHFRPSDRAPLLMQGIYRITQMHGYWIKREKPDLAVISQGNMSSGFDWMEACRKDGIPYVAIVHSNSELWWPNDLLAEKLARVYTAARRVFCISRNNKELLEKQLGVALSKADLIQNPLKLPNREYLPWPEPDKEWRLASVARLEPAAKGQDILLRVLALERWRNRPVQVDFIGEGPSASTLRKWAATLGLTKVDFCGYAPDIQEVWKRHHLLVLPSRYEGTPLALQEAMFCGRPALVTDVGGNAEWCTNGITGFVAAAPTVEIIDECLDRAWQLREKWPSMGRAAHEHMNKFSQPDPVGDFCRKLLELAA